MSVLNYINQFDYFYIFLSYIVLLLFKNIKNEIVFNEFSFSSVLALITETCLIIITVNSVYLHSSWIHFAESYGNCDALDFFQCHKCLQFGHPLIREASSPHDRKVCITVAKVLPMTVTNEENISLEKRKKVL